MRVRVLKAGLVLFIVGAIATLALWLFFGPGITLWLIFGIIGIIAGLLLAVSYKVGDMMICPSCSQKNPQGTVRCENCQLSLAFIE